MLVEYHKHTKVGKESQRLGNEESGVGKIFSIPSSTYHPPTPTYTSVRILRDEHVVWAWYCIPWVMIVVTPNREHDERPLQSIRGSIFWLLIAE